MAKNLLSLDFKDNPELKELLGGKQPGDRVTIEIDVMVTSVTEEVFEGDIEGVSAEECDEEEADDADAQVDSESPVSAVIVMARKKKGSKEDAAPVEETEDDDEETE